MCGNKVFPTRTTPNPTAAGAKSHGRGAAADAVVVASHFDRTGIICGEVGQPWHAFTGISYRPVRWSYVYGFANPQLTELLRSISRS